ncbi:MAG: protein tyrosine phosphatase family protein [Anaerolineae bacterium]|nr:MAG: protein tyrosine phosphatase family protein [Anaerolineae bacterium]
MEGILNYLPISETIGTAGQPTEAQFAAIGAAGYEVVVNLAMPDSSNALPNEGELIVEQGMDYVRIPVVWDAPTMADLARFFAVMEGYRDKKVFVHCVVNMRVSVFVLLYRVLCLGVPLGEARKDMLRIWEPNEVWQSFMEDVLSERWDLSPRRQVRQGG